MRKAVIIIALLSGYTFASSNINDRLQLFMDNYYYKYLSFFPVDGTANGFVQYNNQLRIDISESFISQYKYFVQNTLDSLYTFERNFLTDDKKISYDVLEDVLLNELNSLEFPDYLLPVNHFHFLQGFIQMGSGEGIQPFNNFLDYENFIARLKVFPAWVDTAIYNMRKGMKQNIVLPRRIAQKTIEIVRDQASKKAAQSAFYKPILNFPETFTQRHKIYFDRLYKEIIENEIIPSFRKLETFLSREYIYSCRNSIGLGSLPSGEMWYRYYINLCTTTHMHPDTIYQLGIQEVERISQKMTELKENNYFEGNDHSFRAYLSSGKEFSYSAEDLIDRYRELGEIIYGNLPELFSVIPSSPFELKPIPEEKVKYIGAHYQPSSSAGNLPGIFYFDASNLAKHGAIPNKSLFIHEVIPGHHFQMSLHRELKNIPLFQKFYWNSGYVEGWALYVENLGEQLDVYNDDFDLLVKYSSELLRAVRLVVDTGIHHKGWSHRQAVNYFVEKTGYNISFALQEIDRYIVMPGQAVSYKIGELIILELRKLAHKSLGSDFDLRAFHDEILKDGAMPLDILEQKIVKWIYNKQQEK